MILLMMTHFHQLHPYEAQEFGGSELYRNLNSDATHFRQILATL